MRYLVARIAHAISLWFGVVAVTFLLFHIVPTDPVRTMLGPNASEAQVTTLRQSMGLEKPLIVQFGRFIARLASSDAGRSFVDGRPVGSEVASKLAVTASLALVSIIVIVLALGLIIAAEGGGRWRWLASAVAQLFVSVPTLFSAVVIALLVIGYYPFTRFSGDLSSFGDWMYLVPAAFVLALYPIGILGQIAGEKIREATGSDYVRAARARGLAAGTVLRSYVVRNTAVPLLATFGNQVPLLLTSTFIVEVVFSIPGIGALLLKSVLERDLPMLEGIVMVMALVVIALNLLLELLYPFADPRIRHERSR